MDAVLLAAVGPAAAGGAPWWLLPAAVTAALVVLLLVFLLLRRILRWVFGCLLLLIAVGLVLAAVFSQRLGLDETLDRWWDQVRDRSGPSR